MGWKTGFNMVRLCVRTAGCTKDNADSPWESSPTSFAKRLRRLHISQYTHRIFARPNATGYDAASHQPQYIGRNEGANDYRLKGLFLPVDDYGVDYYELRRLEKQHPGLDRLPSMWKSAAAEASSPTRWTSRSKLGAAFASSSSTPGTSSSSSSKAKPNEIS